LETFNRLKSGGVPPSDEQAERGLKDELYRLVGFDPADVYRVQQPPLISEIGERIANLISFVSALFSSFIKRHHNACFLRILAQNGLYSTWQHYISDILEFLRRRSNV
jgi:hypothetical protein